MYLTSNFYIKSVTYVKTTPVAETIVKFYEIAHFLLKTTPLYKKLPPFYKKNYRWPPEKKLKPLISHYIKKTQFLEDPWPDKYSTLLGTC